jgi:hypothetical protein
MKGCAMAAALTRKVPQPRFSLRTFAALISAACIYLACWRPTCTAGVDDVNQAALVHYGMYCPVRPIAPLLLARDEIATELSVPAIYRTTSTYYVWFYGWVAKLPVTTRTASLQRPPVFDSGSAHRSRLR